MLSSHWPTGEDLFHELRSSWNIISVLECFRVMLDWMAPVISVYWRAVLCTGCRYWGWAALHCAACLCLWQHRSFTHWICFNCTRRPRRERRANSADRHFSRNTAGSVQAGQLSPTPQGTAVPGHSLCVYLSPVHADGIPRAVASLLFPVCGNQCFCAVSFWQDLVISFAYANSHSIVETNLQTSFFFLICILMI